MKARKLGVYYFRQGLFSYVPRSIEAELDDIAETGTDCVCVAVNFTDLGLNDENMYRLGEAIAKRGMELYLVPSRVAGITAGAPLTPDYYGYAAPHTWTILKEGKPLIRRVGPVCSFYHPEVEEHVIETVSQMITSYRPAGIIWDEPKSTNWQDFSALALANNPTGDFRRYLRDYVEFFSRVNLALKEQFPELCIVYFDEACRPDPVVEETARIAGMDYFGVDGRPWDCRDEAIERERKVLFNHGERYLRGAREHGLGSFALVEHQRLSVEDNEIFASNLDRIAGLDIDFMAYYYYRVGSGDIERNMELARAMARRFKGIG
jgi:hypothetical protein